MSGIASSLWRKFTPTTNEPTNEPAPETELDETTEDISEEEDTVEPAYDLTRDQRFNFEETATINTEEESDFATITITTPADSIKFDVRINGYTSLHGELDVEYISIGGYAVMLYHPIPESDKYFARRLYYYGDENGIGSEQHREDTSEPTEIDWSREDYGSLVTTENSSTYISVYDWRENMITTGKPTPNEGQVVLRYKDSFRTGGNRSEVDTVIDVDPLDSGFAPTLDIEYIAVEGGSYALYGVGISEQYKILVPMDEKTILPDDTQWVELEELPDIENVDDVIWAKNPEDTWYVKGF